MGQQDENKKNNKSEKVNWFSRILLLIIGGLIGYMVFFRFFIIDPKAEITTGIIILLAFLIVLALSEIFDSFSIGEVLKLSRTVKEKEKVIEKKESEIVKIENEKNQLLNQVITLSNNFSQRQSNTNIYGLSPDLMRQIGVQKANPEEVEELKKKEAQEAEKEEPSRPKTKRLDSSKIEELALRKSLMTSNIDISKIFREIKLQAFQGIDPISETSPIFDAYLNDIDREVFYEIRQSKGYISGMFMDRLYLMLSKIYHYRTVKKTNAFLNLILVEFPEDSSEDNRQLNRILDLFQPALNNSLLRISVVHFEENEMTHLYES